MWAPIPWVPIYRTGRRARKLSAVFSKLNLDHAVQEMLTAMQNFELLHNRESEICTVLNNMSRLLCPFMPLGINFRNRISCPIHNFWYGLSTDILGGTESSCPTFAKTTPGQRRFETLCAWIFHWIPVQISWRLFPRNGRLQYPGKTIWCNSWQTWDHLNKRWLAYFESSGGQQYLLRCRRRTSHNGCQGCSASLGSTGWRDGRNSLDRCA